MLERSLPTPPARVARSGAVIAAVAIGRYAGLLEFGADGGLTSVTAPLVEGVLASGRHDPRLGVTTAYVHRPEELVDEFADAGLTDVSVYACSGSSRCAP